MLDIWLVWDLATNKCFPLPSALNDAIFELVLPHVNSSSGSSKAYTTSITLLSFTGFSEEAASTNILHISNCEIYHDLDVNGNNNLLQRR